MKTRLLIIIAIVAIVLTVIAVAVTTSTTVPLTLDEKRSVTISKEQAVVTIQNTGPVPVAFLQEDSGIHIKNTHTTKEIDICVVTSNLSKLEPGQEAKLVHFACDKYEQPESYREGSYEIYVTCDDSCQTNTILMTIGNPQEASYESTVKIPDQTKMELIELLQSGQIDEFNKLKRHAVDDAWIPVDSARLNFNGISLEGADLEGANLFRTDLRGANLKNANLQGANMIFADLQDADLYDANLTSAKLGDALVVGANLEEATLRGANLVKANLQDTILVNAKMENAFLEYANLEGADLRYSELNHVVFSSAILNNADLEGSNMQGVDLTHAKLLNANIKDTENLPISLEEAIDRGAIIK